MPASKQVSRPASKQASMKVSIPASVKESMKVRCPDATQQPNGQPHTLIGCGSTDVAWDADDEVFDCRACGIWFTPDCAELVSG